MKPINVSASRSKAVMQIEWTSGDFCELSFSDLRAACPCADCRGTHTATKFEPLSDGLELTLRSDQATKLESITPVGNYAIQISWKDGHTHGIYSWDYLLDLCHQQEQRKTGDAE